MPNEFCVNKTSISLEKQSSKVSHSQIELGGFKRICNSRFGKTQIQSIQWANCRISVTQGPLMNIVISLKSVWGARPD